MLLLLQQWARGCVMWSQRLSDGVRFQALERVEASDVQALGDLRCKVEVQSGGAWGSSSGCLSGFVQGYGARGGSVWVTFGPFQWRYGLGLRDASGRLLRDPGPSPAGSPFGDGKVKAAGSVVVTHDPADSDQEGIGGLDVTSHVAYARSVWFGAGRAWPAAFDALLWPYLWARVVVVETSPDARRVWSTSQRVEVGVTINTRLRARVEFALGASAPSVPLGSDGVPLEAPWVAVGRVARWEDMGAGEYNADGLGVGPGVPRIFPLSALDDVGGWVPFVQGSIWDETTNPPTLSGWAWSSFLSPFPGWWSVPGNDGFSQAGNLINRGLATPPTLGVVSAVGLLADRLRAHLVGPDAGALGEGSWWERPSHGLKWIINKAETLLVQTAQAALDLSNLRGEVDAQAGALRPVACWSWPYNEGGAEWEAGEGFGFVGVPVDLGGGLVRCYLAAGISPRTAAVAPVQNADNAYWGASRPGVWSNVLGGFSAKVNGFGSDVGGPFVEVALSAPDNSTTDGSYTWALGGFSLFVV